MTLRDWFAGQAPEPPKQWMEIMRDYDNGRNPHNDPHKPARRGTAELIAAWNYQYADAMLKARK
jgi:hypothetical protein